VPRYLDLADYLLIAETVLGVPVERAEGGGAPPRGRTGARVTVEWWYDGGAEVFA